jgi:hypothetical protein
MTGEYIRSGIHPGTPRNTRTSLRRPSELPGPPPAQGQVAHFDIGDLLSLCGGRQTNGFWPFGGRRQPRSGSRSSVPRSDGRGSGKRSNGCPGRGDGGGHSRRRSTGLASGAAGAEGLRNGLDRLVLVVLTLAVRVIEDVCFVWGWSDGQSRIRKYARTMTLQKDDEQPGQLRDGLLVDLDVRSHDLQVVSGNGGVSGRRHAHCVRRGESRAGRLGDWPSSSR